MIRLAVRVQREQAELVLAELLEASSGGESRKAAWRSDFLLHGCAAEAAYHRSADWSPELAAGGHGLRPAGDGTCAYRKSNPAYSC